MKHFARYPQVVQMDCQANVNKSTDGFNVVGVCGNYHNVAVLKAFVGSQKAETFRWILSVAFMFLVLNYARIRTIITDGCQALIGELRAECHHGGMFPNAIMLRCLFHILIDAFDRDFGYAMQSPCFQDIKQWLFKLRACESREEFVDCREFVLRRAAGIEADGFPRKDVIKFIMSRLTNPEDWVLFAHISCETRGCHSTQRCESEHGHSRNDRVNARCSWLLTIIRYERLLTSRMKKLMKWASRQLNGSLARGVTNASDSTLSLATLKYMDSAMLPWQVETVEEQMLLGRGDLRCVYTASEGTKHTFAVWYEGEKDDNDDAHKLRTDEIGESSDDGDSEADDDDDEDLARAKRQKGADPVAEDWTEEMEEELEEIMENPINSETKFVFRRIRKVVVMKDPKDAANMLMSCSCGYHKRIGVACRHIWCLLFTILKAFPIVIEGIHRITNICVCMSKPTTCPSCMAEPQYSKFDWENFPTFDFRKMVNMDLGNKVKYHAILHTDADTENIFPDVHSTVFFPRIPASLFQRFVSNNDPEGSDDVPKSGLPQTSDVQDGDEFDDTVTGSSRSSQPQQRTADRTQREEVPTFQRLHNKLEALWDRVQRLKKAVSNSAKSLILRTLISLEEQIFAQHPDKEPKRMQRYFSRRDKYMGIANQ